MPDQASEAHDDWQFDDTPYVLRKMVRAIEWSCPELVRVAGQSTVQAFPRLCAVTLAVGLLFGFIAMWYNVHLMLYRRLCPHFPLLQVLFAGSSATHSDPGTSKRRTRTPRRPAGNYSSRTSPFRAAGNFTPSQTSDLGSSMKDYESGVTSNLGSSQKDYESSVTSNLGSSRKDNDSSGATNESSFISDELKLQESLSGNVEKLLDCPSLSTLSESSCTGYISNNADDAADFCDARETSYDAGISSAAVGEAGIASIGEAGIASIADAGTVSIGEAGIASIGDAGISSASIADAGSLSAASSAHREADEAVSSTPTENYIDEVQSKIVSLDTDFTEEERDRFDADEYSEHTSGTPDEFSFLNSTQDEPCKSSEKLLFLS